MRIKISHHSNGFTLVEMAMVLLIIALLMAGLVPTISGQIERQQIKETQQQLKDISDALLGFAITRGRLPCPASDNSNGEESIESENCTHAYNGFVPATTLGLSGTIENGLLLDAWNHPIRYAVTTDNAYTKDVAATGIANLKPNLIVCSTGVGISGSDCASSSRLTASGNEVPVILFSTGKNGANTNSIDELANLANRRTFVSHTATATSASGGEFDDIVIWISNHTLINRMVVAGRLP